MATEALSLVGIQRRLQKADLSSIIFLYLLGFVALLLLNYPTYSSSRLLSGSPKVTWQVLLSYKLIVFTCIALAYGLSAIYQRAQALHTFVALLSIWLFTLPLDIVVHTLSQPTAPWWWLPCLSLLNLLAYLALGYMLARFLWRRSLKNMLVWWLPLILLVCLGLDLLLGRALWLSWMLQAQEFLPHSLLMLVLSGLAGGLWYSDSSRRAS